jgi:hypothetical protein
MADQYYVVMHRLAVRGLLLEAGTLQEAANHVPDIVQCCLTLHER